MISLAKNVSLFLERGADSLEALSCNVYFLQKDNELVLIDAGNSFYSKELLKVIGNRRVARILLTHGHFDHSSGASALKAKAFLHPKDVALLKKLNRFLPDFVPPENIAPLDFARFDFGGFRLRVIETPGHTQGSVSFLDEANGFLFSGDTLFAEGICGRTDLEGGDAGEMEASLEKIRALDYSLLCPGHGQVEKRKK